MFCKFSQFGIILRFKLWLPHHFTLIFIQNGETCGSPYLDKSNKLVYQLIPFKSTSLPSESVTLNLISEIIFDETGEYSALRGSKVNGRDLVRLSVGITAIVSVFIPSTILFFIALVLILVNQLNLWYLVVLYHILSCWLISFQILRSLQILFLADLTGNYYQE